eukprot:1828161-Lingulodinium_polyedra.AAC.1
MDHIVHHDDCQLQMVGHIPRNRCARGALVVEEGTRREVSKRSRSRGRGENVQTVAQSHGQHMVQ